MRLFIKGLSGLSFLLDVPQHSAIVDLKFIIFNHLGVAPIHQNLVYRGKVLNDQSNIERCGIHNGCTLYLALCGYISPKKLESIHEKLDNLYVEQVMQTPEVQELIQTQPLFLNQNEIDDYIRENLALGRCPAAANEVNRLADISLDNWESQPGGFAELVQNYHDFEDTDIDAIIYGSTSSIMNNNSNNNNCRTSSSANNNNRCQKEFETVIPEPLDEPSTEPLPTPYISNNNSRRMNSANRRSYGYNKSNQNYFNNNNTSNINEEIHINNNDNNNNSNNGISHRSSFRNQTKQYQSHLKNQVKNNNNNNDDDLFYVDPDVFLKDTENSVQKIVDKFVPLTNKNSNFTSTINNTNEDNLNTPQIRKSNQHSYLILGEIDDDDDDDDDNDVDEDILDDTTLPKITENKDNDHILKATSEVIIDQSSSAKGGNKQNIRKQQVRFPKRNTLDADQKRKKREENEKSTK